MFGAVLGGFAEYLSMVLGNQMLILIVALLYGIAAAIVSRRSAGLC